MQSGPKNPGQQAAACTQEVTTVAQDAHSSQEGAGEWGEVGGTFTVTLTRQDWEQPLTPTPTLAPNGYQDCLLKMQPDMMPP